MILKEVKLERFKAAFQPKPIPLEPFNVLIGRNGSGKSTLLEALQWLDVTIRQDARVACDRYYGMQDLVNLQSRAKKPFFCLDLEWHTKKEEIFRYHVKVEANKSVPVITKEELEEIEPNGHVFQTHVLHSLKHHGGNGGSERLLLVSPRWEPNSSPEVEDPTFKARVSLKNFWFNAVFLRLSPNRLANGSSAVRKSFEPLLDEEGQTLPALLHELTPEQQNELAEQLEEIMPGIRGVEMSKAD